LVYLYIGVFGMLGLECEVLPVSNRTHSNTVENRKVSPPVPYGMFLHECLGLACVRDFQPDTFNQFGELQKSQPANQTHSKISSNTDNYAICERGVERGIDILNKRKRNEY